MQIRGSALALARDEVRGLLGERRLAPEELRRHLLPEDLSYLDAEIHAELWYPIRVHDRLVTTLRDLEGAGSADFLVERGRRLGGLLLARPVVRALEEARAEVPEAASWWAHAGAVLVALPSALFSCSTWLLVPDDEPGRFTVEVTDAAELPESSRLGVQGALEALASELTGRAVHVASERPRPDCVLYQGRPARKGSPPPL